MAKVLWFTGISGAGKSTLSEKLVQILTEHKQAVELLDGNYVRDFFENDLGFSPEDRKSVTKRIIFAAYLLAKNNVNVVVANIAPSYEIRDFARQKLGDYYVQIYLKASIAAVVERDVWGHYEKHKQGKEKNLIGIDDPYQEPRNPDLILDTDADTENESFIKLLEHLKPYFSGLP